MGRDSIQLTLPSNASFERNPNNKPQDFKISLANPIKLNDAKWEVALTEIQYPNNWFNIKEETTMVIMIINIEDQIKNVENLTDSSSSHNASIVSLAAIHKRVLTQQNEPITSKINEDSAEIHYTFPPGMYESVTHICDTINNGITDTVASCLIGKPNHWINRRKPVVFSYNTTSQRVTMSSASINVSVWAKNGAELWKILGFDLKPRDSIILPTTGTSQAAINLNYPALFIYCSLVEHQIVGDALAPLLRTVPIRGINQEVISEIFTRPYYLNVSNTQGYINDIDVWICNDAGDLIPFQSGKVILGVNLRRKGLA